MIMLYSLVVFSAVISVTSGQVCSYSSQCPSGYSCSNGRCTYAASTGSLCSINGKPSNILCAADGGCSFGVCKDTTAGRYCCDQSTGTSVIGGLGYQSEYCPTNYLAQTDYNGVTKVCYSYSLFTCFCDLGYTRMLSSSGSGNYVCCKSVSSSITETCPSYTDRVYISPTTNAAQICNVFGGYNSCPTGYTCQYSSSGTGNYVCCGNGGPAQQPQQCPNGQPPYTSNSVVQSCTVGNSNSCPSSYRCEQSNGYNNNNNNFDPDSGICCMAQTGYIGGSCAYDSYARDYNKCYDSGTCVNGYCSCTRDEVESYDYSRGGSRCDHLPSLGDDCSYAQICKDLNAACVKTSSTTTNKWICSCDSKQCYEEVDNKCERKRLNIGDACTSDCQCIAAYSYCDATSNKCACRNGFTAQTDGTCQGGATTKACPFDQPLQDTNGNVIDCELTPNINHRNKRSTHEVDIPAHSKSPTKEKEDVLKQESSFAACTANMYSDNCADGSYCVAESNNKMDNFYYNYNVYTNTKIKGFCCKLQPPKCPIGDAHSSSVAPKYGCDSCPETTHYCHYDGHGTSLSICCAKQCPADSDIMVNGKCYPIVLHGQACEVDEQCHNGLSCLTVGSSKECACPNKDQIFHLIEQRCIVVNYCNNGGTPFTDSDERMITCASSEMYAVINAEASSECPIDTDCDRQYGVCCTRPSGSRTCRLRDYVMSSQSCRVNNDCSFGRGECTGGYCCYPNSG